MIVYQIQRINSTLTVLTRITMSITVAAMAILIMLSVIVRNLLGFSFQWIVDVNRLIFIWMCFLGLVYVSDKELLIRFDIIERHFSPGLHKALTLLRYVASLVLFGIMVKAGLEVSQFAKAQVFSTIPISTSWLYIAVITAGALLVFQTVVKILVLLIPPLSGKEAGIRQHDRM
jgi:TRAP-type C4-dicarboxylate transport system permease small subunit